jgi:sugar fermentation stimulation protein A
MRTLATPVFVGYDRPLVPATLIARRDRFIADVRLENGVETRAHCINPGRMEAFVDEGAKIWLQPAEEGSSRKLAYTWELLEHRGIVCSTNTVRPNKLVAALLQARALPGADDWTELKPEYSIPPALTGDASHKTRVDFMLTGGITHYLEVKNCHLVADDGWGYFPDSVSDRAAKHVGCLAQLAERGYRATVLLCVQRSDCRLGVRPSDFHDPTFATAARAAAAAGVEFRAVRATTDVVGTTLTHELPVDLEPYDTTAVAAEWERNVATTGWVRTASGARVANGPFPHNKPKKTPKRARAEEVD